MKSTVNCQSAIEGSSRRRGIRALVIYQHDTLTRRVTSEKRPKLCFKPPDFGYGVAHTRLLGDGSRRAAVLCIVHVPPIVHDHGWFFLGAAGGQE